MERWETFYVIVGSSAAALIGIQFVVVTLVAGIRTLTTAESISAFGTPTVVHLSFALVVSAFMTVPWESPFPVAALAAACGLAGVGYVTIVLRRARRQTVYQPVWEDWVWHGVLPAACYLALILAALLRHSLPRPSLFAIAASALALLLIGIHNAWDTVVHVIVTAAREGDR